MRDHFERAADFVWRYGRPIEKYRLAFHFLNGPQSAVLASLRTYQNTDCGFGHALEPDKRFPGSTPADVMTALNILDEVEGFGDPLILETCCYLEDITTPEGGIPFTLPMVRCYPHTPWWATEDPNPPASLNPTGDVAGLLLKHNIQHPWLDQAVPFCWQSIDNHLESYHDIMPAVVFLAHVPDQERASSAINSIKSTIKALDLVGNDRINQNGYHKYPLDWAPYPQHPLRSLFSDQQIEEDLMALVNSQLADGGWAINWQTISPEVENEWRGIQTLKNLLILKAYGKI
jgi:hypothetical protein